MRLFDHCVFRSEFTVSTFDGAPDIPLLSTSVDANKVLVVIVLAVRLLSARLFVQNVLLKELSVRTLNCAPGLPVLSIKVDMDKLDTANDDIYGASIGTISPFVEVIKTRLLEIGISYRPNTYVVLEGRFIAVLKISGALFMATVPGELI